VYTGMASAYEV